MRRLHGMPLALAITLALIVKVIILMALHKAFFSAPQAKKMRMPTATVEQHLLGNPPLPVSAPKAQP
ncbi:MAG: cytochrome oxidase putative small subunit CydP [Pseudomonadota bacterium]